MTSSIIDADEQCARLFAEQLARNQERQQAQPAIIEVD